MRDFVVSTTNMPVTSGTVARSLISHCTTILTVDDFGAVGDGHTDDTAAFAAYRTYLFAKLLTGDPQRAWMLGNGKIYLISAPLDLTGFTFFDFEGNHSTIFLYNVATYAILDILGTTDSSFHNLRVLGGTQALPLTNGIQFGRFSQTQGYPENSFYNITVDGYFTRAAMYNRGSESLSCYSLKLYNRYTSSGQSTWAYCLIQDGTDHWPLTSSYVTVSTPVPDVYLSFNDDVYYSPIFYNLGNGPAVWMCGAQRHKYVRGYNFVQSTTAPGAVFYFKDLGAGVAHAITELEWEVHTEVTATADIMFTGYATPSMSGFKFNNHFIQSGHTFLADTGVTGVTFVATELRASGFTSGATMFDQPSLYAVSGEVYLLSAYAASWNGSTFSGTILTDSASTFRSGATFGAGAYSVMDTTSAIRNSLTVGTGAAEATSATTGHMMIPFCAGTPTGVPTGASTGISLRYDTTAHKLWAYDNGTSTWKGIVLT